MCFSVQNTPQLKISSKNICNMPADDLNLRKRIKFQINQHFSSKNMKLNKIKTHNAQDFKDRISFHRIYRYLFLFDSSLKK